VAGSAEGELGSYGKISTLHPLSFKEAVRELLQVTLDDPAKEEKKRDRRPMGAGLEYSKFVGLGDSTRSDNVPHEAKQPD
jgi:hypothetical protein